MFLATSRINDISLLLCFVKSKQEKGVSGAAKATRIQLSNAAAVMGRVFTPEPLNAAPIDGYNAERAHSTDEVEASPEFQPSDLIGRTFLMDAQPDGQKFCATIFEAIAQH